MKNKPNFLPLWLADPRFELFLGRAASIKVAALAALVTNGRCNASEIARRFGVSHVAAGKHVRNARRIYGIPKRKVSEI
jgi:hypothetical protein